MRSNSFVLPKSSTTTTLWCLTGRIALIIFMFFYLSQSGMSKTKKKELFVQGTIPEKLAGDFQFTEGPACDNRGNIFFSDQPNNRIMKWSTENKLSLFGENFGRANGMHFDHKGNLVTCSDEKNELWSITPAG